jgi:hypothetical protein
MRFPVVLFALLAAASSIVAPSLAAQRLEHRAFPTFDARRAPSTPAARSIPTTPRTPEPNTGGMVLGGLLLGAGGLFAGALLGDRFQRYPCEDCIEGAFYGALVGESLAIPLGVHLGDRRQGNAGTALAASLAIGALGLGAAAATDEWRLLLAIPVAQLASSMVIERHTALERVP